MSQGLRDFIVNVEDARKLIVKSNSVQVNSQKERKSLQQLVDSYFRDVRPSVVSHTASSDFIMKIDTGMQDLLVCSHKRTKRNLLKRKLSGVKKKLIQLEAHSAVLVGAGSSTESANLMDRRIIEILQPLVPSAALSYEQALIDLDGPDRKSWRGPATDLREALRETLDYLAPDKDVTSQPGFKLEPDSKGPTMKQKTRFILVSRGLSKTLSETPEKAVDSIETVIGSFVRSVYRRSSVSTHTPTVRDEVLLVRDWVRIVLCELLEIR